MAIGSNNRYENLDGLKVIAAFGIVAMHDTFCKVISDIERLWNVLRIL